MTNAHGIQTLTSYPLLTALLGRRSRRFGLGMKIEEGPFAFASAHPPHPLSEDEEAALAFAACGVTGYALADLAYGRGQGGSMLGGLVGRTIASPDALNVVSVAVINDEATYLLRRPQDFPATELPDLIRLAQSGELVELYRRSRVKVRDGRAAPPLEPLFNFNINRWSLYASGTTYFLPVNELSALYINVLLELFDEETGAYVLDERAGMRPAGLGPFARSKGGHLRDDPKDARFGVVGVLEAALGEAAAIEQGMVLQNLGLMAQALGLCGFPNYARHEYAWLEALGFRMAKIPLSRYLGLGPLLSLGLRLARQDAPIPVATGLEADGLALKPYCPPHYHNMEAAVRAFVATKFGESGCYRGGARASGWKDPAAAARDIPAVSEAAVAATIAYCDYLYRRYSRFPATVPPFRTILGFQACHGDLDFYDRFYQPEALTDAQREHASTWHGDADRPTQASPQ